MGDEVHRVQAPGGAGLIHVEAEPQPAHRAGSLQWAGLVAVAIAAVVADQVTKRAIENRLALDEAHHVLPGLTITHVRNSGIAFGIFPGRLMVVSVLTAAAVIWMLVHFARSGSRHVLFPVALGLLVGGSVSNLADRIREGHVTDFIHITHWPTFNLADSFIVIGVALLALGLIRVEHKKSQASPPVEPDPSPGLDRP
jgi:signal peptidase II